MGRPLLESWIFLLESRMFLLKSRIFLLGNRIFLLESRSSILENSSSLLQTYTKILKVPCKMVFGHNLHMAPFEFLEAQFCTDFWHTSFWFLCPRVDFGTIGPILGPPGQHFGPGTFRGHFLPQHTFIADLICHGGSGDSV